MKSPVAERGWSRLPARMTPHVGVAQTESEREAIYRLRYQVYIEEMGLPLPADREGKRLLEPPGSGARLLYARDGDTMVATLRLELGKDGALGDEHTATYQIDRFSEIV